MATHRCYFLNQVSIAILLALFVQKTFATPYLLLGPTQDKKCVVAEFPKRSKIIVEYDVLDFDLTKNDELSMSFKLAKAEDWDDLVEKETKLDANGKVEYDHHSKKKGDQHEVNICIQRKRVSRKAVLISLKLKETVVGEDVKDDFKDLFASLEMLGNKPKENKSGENPIVGEDIFAGTDLFAGLELLKDKKAQVATPSISEQQKERREMMKDQKVAFQHMTYLEKAIYNMVRETDLLINNADASKEQEAIFFQQGMDMHMAAKWWPILHLLVLFVTGYTQANHIVSFFKTRHII